jgi:hypothetical protein
LSESIQIHYVSYDISLMNVAILSHTEGKKHTKCILAVLSKQPSFVSELKCISKNRKSPRTRRNAAPGAPNISNGHDNGKKAYKETCPVCEQLSEQMIEREDLIVTRNRPFAAHFWEVVSYKWQTGGIYELLIWED